MPQADRLQTIRNDFVKLSQYISNAYVKDAAGVYQFNVEFREFTVSSSFIGLHISWESFLEGTFVGYLIGEPTISGAVITKYASPCNIEHAQNMLIGTQKYVDWSNPEIVLKLVRLYFPPGNQFETAINSIKNILFDIKTIRNSCAHISSTTSRALDSLASRLLNGVVANISVTDFILRIDPNGNGVDTILDTYIHYLDAAAESISL